MREKVLQVVAIKIDEYNDYIIHGFPKDGAGKHGNDYVKIVKGSVRGKFRFDTETWEPRYDLGKKIKKELTKYLLENKEDLRDKILALG